ALGGSWQTPSNWDLNRVPGAGDDVVIPDLGSPGANLTVTYGSCSTTVASIDCAEHFRLSGGIPAGNGALPSNPAANTSLDGTITAGGTLRDAIVLAPTMNNNSGALSGVTLAAGTNYNVAGFFNSATITNGLTVSGTVALGGGNSNFGILFSGTQT